MRRFDKIVHQDEDDNDKSMESIEAYEDRK